MKAPTVTINKFFPLLCFLLIQVTLSGCDEVSNKWREYSKPKNSAELIVKLQQGESTNNLKYAISLGENFIATNNVVEPEVYVVMARIYRENNDTVKADAMSSLAANALIKYKPAESEIKAGTVSIQRQSDGSQEIRAGDVLIKTKP